jgi:hypothetical protein
MSDEVSKINHHEYTTTRHSWEFTHHWGSMITDVHRYRVTLRSDGYISVAVLRTGKTDELNMPRSVAVALMQALGEALINPRSESPEDLT